MSFVEDVSRLAEKRGDFVRLQREPGDEQERQRIGTPHRLPVAMSAFTDLLSLKARKKEHSGIMECQALLISAGWILRSKMRHNAHAAILVDAKTVLCAAAKGRSSSPSLLRLLRMLRPNF